MSHATVPLSRTAKVWLASLFVGGGLVLAAIVYLFPSRRPPRMDERPATEAIAEVTQESVAAPAVAPPVVAPPVIAPPRPSPAQTAAPRLQPIEPAPPAVAPVPTKLFGSAISRQFAAAHAAALRAAHGALTAGKAADGGR
jgi:hypothetical protein